MEYYNPRLLVIVKSTAMYFIPTFLHLYYIINYVICINKPEVEPSRAGGQLGHSSLWVTLSPSQIVPSSFLSPHTSLPHLSQPHTGSNFFFSKAHLFQLYEKNLYSFHVKHTLLGSQHYHTHTPRITCFVCQSSNFQLMSPHFSDCCFINNEGSTTQIKVVRFLDSKDEIKPTHIIHLIKGYM